jgi:hypothetical protein
MPSVLNPVGLVNPGPGKLSTGVVPASALLFPGGGSGAAALLAHINDPVDAHMASAIGVNPIYLPTGEPLLQSAGGVLPGESVLDFIAVAKDLFPLPPDTIGFDTPSPNSGLPNWGALATIQTGGWSDGLDVIGSHFLVPVTDTTYTLSGIVFPADRGVAALYYSTDGDYFNPGTTTLISALWLGSTVSAPPGMESANFNIALRAGLQPNYVATGIGLDQMSLTFRLPYLEDYTPYLAPYSNYNVDFFSYQLATYAVTPQAIAAGDAGSWLLVHWKESFATSLVNIQPANLTLLTLVSSNAFSAVPVAGDFNIGDALQVNRRYVFRDSNSGTAPSGNLWSSAQVGLPTTVLLSGVAFYNNGGTPLTWNIDLRVNGLFDNCYRTGDLPNVDVPVPFTSPTDPIRINLVDFGAGPQGVPYYDLRKLATPPNYNITNAPQIGDIAQFLNPAYAIVSPASASPTGGYGLLRAQLIDPFNAAVLFNDTTRYLFNSYPQTGGASDEVEAFIDEEYRYLSTFTASSYSVPLVPAPIDSFDSTAVLAASGPDLQVVGHQLKYPSVDFSSAVYRPGAQPNYAAVLAADPGSHIRRFVRAFDTGIARNTGKLRIQGVAFANWQSDVAFTGSEVTDHPFGCILQVKIPGSGPEGTGWLDVGRVKGDPDLTITDFRGCRTALTGSVTDFTVTFNTTNYTIDNGFGEFLLFVRISLIKNGTGEVLSINEVEWLPP